MKQLITQLQRRINAILQENQQAEKLYHEMLDKNNARIEILTIAQEICSGKDDFHDTEELNDEKMPESRAGTPIKRKYTYHKKDRNLESPDWWTVIPKVLSLHGEPMSATQIIGKLYHNKALRTKTRTKLNTRCSAMLCQMEKKKAVVRTGKQLKPGTKKSVVMWTMHPDYR